MVNRFSRHEVLSWFSLWEVSHFVLSSVSVFYHLFSFPPPQLKKKDINLIQQPVGGRRGQCCLFLVLSRNLLFSVNLICFTQRGWERLLHNVLRNVTLIVIDIFIFSLIVSR